MTRRSPVTVAAERRRQYDAASLALYAAFVEHRAPYRPAQCHGQSPCWVTDGPPAMAGERKRCLGCNGSPRSLVTRPIP